MAYVDLNPVRAGIAKTPEDSDHTSIQRRIRALQAAADPEAPDAQEHCEPEPPIQPPELLTFVGGERQDGPKGLPFHLPDYLELVNWTGQAIRDDKRGAISQDLPPILQRLGIDEQAWLRLATQFESSFNTWVGKAGMCRTPASASAIARPAASVRAGCCFRAESSLQPPSNDPDAPENPGATGALGLKSV